MIPSGWLGLHRGPPTKANFFVLRLALGEERHHVRRGVDMIARLLIALVRAYQVVFSPWLGKVCRFEPSCSRYAVACLEAHGAMRGSLLSVRRLCKCHPFHPGGFDPPPG
jgi:putative membrane protein insertion efficiency factor